MHNLLLELPSQIESDRLYLRSYQAGDGQIYSAVNQANRAHLGAHRVRMECDDTNERSCRVAD